MTRKLVVILEVKNREMRFTLKKQKITTATPSSSSPTSSSSSSSSFSPSSSLQQTMVGGRIIRAMILSIKIVFNSWIYIAVAGAVASIFWIIFNIFDQLLFFSPVFVFYLPPRCVHRLYPFKYNCDSFGHSGEHEYIYAQTFG
ncbi:MAG: hypothetical protein WBE61_06725 [Nitrososphaeraceae archaeon]